MYPCFICAYVRMYLLARRSVQIYICTVTGKLRYCETYSYQHAHSLVCGRTDIHLHSGMVARWQRAPVRPYAPHPKHRAAQEDGQGGGVPEPEASRPREAPVSPRVPELSRASGLDLLSVLSCNIVRMIS